MNISSYLVGQKAYRYNKLHSSAVANSVERLSSGLKINRAADDASGLSISRKMREKIRELTAQQEGVSSSLSSSQITDSTLDGIQKLLSRMNELGIKSASDTYLFDRQALDVEYQELLSEIGRLEESHCSTSTLSFGVSKSAADAIDSALGGEVYTGRNLYAFLDALDANLGELERFSSGGDMSADDVASATADFIKNNARRLLNTPSDETDDTGGIYYSITTDGGKIEVSSSLFTPPSSDNNPGLKDTNLLSRENAEYALSKIKQSINSVSSYRSSVGTIQRRLEATQNNIDRMIGELTGSISMIEDADMAKELMVYFKEQVLTQTSSFAMLHVRQSAEEVIEILTL